MLAPPLTALGCNVFQPPPDPSVEDSSAPDGTSMREAGEASGIDVSVEAPPPETGADAGNDTSTGIDAGTEAGMSGNDGSTQPWWPHKNSHGCMSAGVPLATDLPDRSDPGSDLPPIYVAIDRFLTGSANNDLTLTQNSNAWEDQGFDIDDVCTNSATCPDTTDPSGQTLIDDPGCVNAQVVPYDGNLCRDNALGKSFGIAAQVSEVGQWFGFTEQDINCELLRGGFSVIFKISGYNGQLNDRDVQVDMYNSMGLVNLPSWKCRLTIDTPLDPNWPTSAPWMSTDPWLIDSNSFDISTKNTDAGVNDLPEGAVRDYAAFVRNGWLIVHLAPDNSLFWFDAERSSVGINATPGTFPGFRSFMHRNVIAARISKDQYGYWNLTNGTISWVNTPGDVVKGFREIGFCENMCQGYNQLINYLTNSVDTVTTGQPNMALPTTPCDGLSGGFAFLARQATISPKYVQASAQPMDCPEPLSMYAPRQGAGCNCEAGLGCPPDDGGNDAGADAHSDASTPDGGSTDGAGGG